jgi:hypothetical protein
VKRAAVVLLAISAAWYAALPPRALPAGAAPVELRAPVRGALHIHTRRSDGTGTVESVAAAASRAGLRFIVLTDHGDGARPAEPPTYRAGVLCIDAVEISTAQGHVLALGLPAAPYPLGGEARDVVADIERLGGFAIAAHPGSAKSELQWTDWSVPVGGIEWLNADSEWRDESAVSLMRALFAYPARSAEALATLLDRPAALMERWDALSGERRVVALAAADAHARIGLRTLGEPYESRALLPLPSYEDLFRTFSISVPDITMTGDAAQDAAAVLEAIRQGRVYSSVDALATPAALSFTQDGTMLRVLAQAPPGASTVLLKDGQEVVSVDGRMLEHDAAGKPGVYRVEVRLPGAPGQPPIPWMMTNAIYMGRSAAAATSTDSPSAVTQTKVVYGDDDASAWAVEQGARSVARLDRLRALGGGTQLGFRFALGGAPSESPYAAMVMPAGSDVANYDRLIFTGQANREMRVSVQLRAAGGDGGQRWHRSVVLDPIPREVTIFFDDMRPRGATDTERPALTEVQSVLFVIDTVNADTGANGQFIIDEVRYAR